MAENSIPPPVKSEPPIVKAALIGQHTIVSLGSLAAVVTLALQQNWSSEISLAAIAAIAGGWALGSLRVAKK
jgi:hypothetical protein